MRAAWFLLYLMPATWALMFPLARWFQPYAMIPQGTFMALLLLGFSFAALINWCAGLGPET